MPTVAKVTRLSVIVPCYQVGPYVRQTLTSLVRNAAPGIEVVLVDDASTDATPMILAEHADRLGPLTKIIRHPVNAGLAAARNTGLRAATGEHITFLDGDDWLGPGHLADLLGAVERLGCDLVRTDHVQVTGRARQVRRVPYGPRGQVGSPRSGILPAHRMTSVDHPYAWAGIYHRRLLDAGLLAFDEQLRTCEDRPWAWRLHLRATSFAVVGLTGLFYRRAVTSSLSQVTDERQLDFLPAFDLVVDEVARDADAERLMPKVLRSYLAIMHHHLDRRPLYERALGDELVRRSRDALARLPRSDLGVALADLDPDRRQRLNRLVAA